jgi:4-hydroxy-tetrahydrodipicolinate synthase
MIDGAGTAVVTPFKQDGSVDYEAYMRLIEKQARGGMDFIVVLGTTGESPTIKRERERIIDLSIAKAKGLNPTFGVVVGTGTYDTAESVELSRFAASAGADGVLVVTPYYNKPTPDGLFGHFTEIAQAVPELPVILYDIPVRSSGIAIQPATSVKILKENPNVIGRKEAAGLEHFLASREAIEQERIAGNIKQEVRYFSGDDGLNMAMMLHGADGVISVVGNLDPKLTSDLVRACREGNTVRANQIYWAQGFYALSKALFIESNPIPIKAALAMTGEIEEVYRKPMVPMQPANRQKLEAVLRQYSYLPVHR